MKFKRLAAPLAVLSMGASGPALTQSIQQIDPDQGLPQPTASTPQTPIVGAEAATAAAADAANAATSAEPHTDHGPSPLTEASPDAVAAVVPPKAKPSDPEELAAIRSATDSANAEMLAAAARKNAAYEEELARVRAAEDQYKTDMAEFERKAAAQKALADEYEVQRKAWEARYHKPVPN